MRLIFNPMVDYSQRGLDGVFSAIADPTRRAILRRLARKPATITEIARPFAVSLNAVSKHVKVLERAGLIRREVMGRRHVCRLQPTSLKRATAWLDECTEFWQTRFDALESYVAGQMQAKKSTGGSRARNR